jgi:hypothetical protein
MLVLNLSVPYKARSPATSCRVPRCPRTNAAHTRFQPFRKWTMAPPLPLPAVFVLLTITAVSLLHGLFGPPCEPAHNAPRTRACHYVARVTVVPPSAPPPISARSRPRHQAERHGPTLTVPSHVPPGSRSRPMPGLGHDSEVTAPAQARRSRPQMVSRPDHGSAVPSPHCSRLVVTFPSPHHVPLVTSQISGHVPLLTPGGHCPTQPHVPWSRPHSSSRPLVTSPPTPSQSIPLHMMHCSDWGSRLIGAFMAPSSKPGAGPVWLVCTPRHFTPSVTLVRALGPPASSPAGAAVEE